jgi:hypothetical protein
MAGLPKNNLRGGNGTAIERDNGGFRAPHPIALQVAPGGGLSANRQGRRTATSSRLTA